MGMEPGKLYDVNRDGRISDIERFLDDRRWDALAMIALGRRRTKPRAADRLAVPKRSCERRSTKTEHSRTERPAADAVSARPMS
jgi:hypothetical protein